MVVPFEVEISYTISRWLRVDAEDDDDALRKIEGILPQDGEPLWEIGEVHVIPDWRLENDPWL